MQSKEIIFQEIEHHLLNDSRPSDYFNDLAKTEMIHQPPFHMLCKLKEAEQSVKHHPEGNVWNHTMMVLDEAAKVKDQSKDQRVFMWAALLHDIGKPDTTRRRKGRITSYNHENIGAKLAEEFLSYFTEETELIQQVRELIRYHMQILFVVKGMQFADIKGMKKHTDYREVALLGLCDRLGRGHSDIEEEHRNIERFLEICGRD